MPDIRERLAVFDGIDPPDLWAAALDRAPRPPDPDRPPRLARISAVALALVVAAGGLLLVFRVFGDAERHTEAIGPKPSVSASVEPTASAGAPPIPSPIGPSPVATTSPTTDDQGNAYDVQSTTVRTASFTIGPPLTGSSPRIDPEEIIRLAENRYGKPDSGTKVAVVFASYSDHERGPSGDQYVHAPVWLVTYSNLCAQAETGNCTYPYWTYVFDADSGHRIIAFSSGPHQ